MNKGNMKAKRFGDMSKANYNNLKNPLGERMIHVATLVEDMEMLKLMIEEKVDVNAVSNRKHTALHYTASKGFVDGARILLENGCNVDAQDSDGNTALHLNVVKGNIDVIKVLIKNGANVNIKNNNNETPLNLCNTEEIAALLKLEGAQRD